MYIFYLFLAHLYEVKECLCDTPSAGLCGHVLGLVPDQNVLFLRLGQFLSYYKG